LIESNQLGKRLGKYPDLKKGNADARLKQGRREKIDLIWAKPGLLYGS